MTRWGKRFSFFNLSVYSSLHHKKSHKLTQLLEQSKSKACGFSSYPNCKQPTISQASIHCWVIFQHQSQQHCRTRLSTTKLPPAIKGESESLCWNLEEMQQSQVKTITNSPLPGFTSQGYIFWTNIQLTICLQWSCQHLFIFFKNKRLSRESVQHLLRKTSLPVTSEAGFQRWSLPAIKQICSVDVLLLLGLPRDKRLIAKLLPSTGDGNSPKGLPMFSRNERSQLSSNTI